MPTNTLDFAPAYTGQGVKHIERSVGSTVQISTTRFIAALRRVLLAAGWSEIESYFAAGQISYPTGLPTVTPSGGPPTLVGCGSVPFLSIGGVGFSGYNPYTSTPAGGPCVWFQWGLTSAESATNLAAAITASTSYDAAQNSLGVALTAKFPGPDWNFIPVDADGRFGLGGTLTGGGYKMRSAALPGTDQYDVTILGVGGGDWTTGDGQVRIAAPGIGPYNIDTHAVSPEPINRFTMLGSPAGFAFFADRDDYLLRYTSLLVTAPQKISSDLTTYYFALAPTSFRAVTRLWDGASAWANGVAESYFSQNGPQLLAVRSPGPTPLVTFGGQPFVIRAWMMGHVHQTDPTPAVLGGLWDAVVISDYFPGGAMVGGVPHETVSAQNGSTTDFGDLSGNINSTRCTLLWPYNTVI